MYVCIQIYVRVCLNKAVAAVLVVLEVEVEVVVVVVVVEVEIIVVVVVVVEVTTHQQEDSMLQCYLFAFVKYTQVPR